ncbi:MAG: DUF5615 family PIN-like protein [Flavobacteriales bacterium]|jgi:predicted nuclease of predicted toxin-antitoxin system|nr:DUF5615 family PIN-like protein [Flavobacteriales bacterium]
MRFLANENFPDPSITILRGEGHVVTSVRTDAPGISDPLVIAKAQARDLIILTFDKDYGELIFKEGVTDPPAVVFFRYRGVDPQAAAKLLLDAIAQNTALTNRFTVIEEDGIRQRLYG